MHSRHVESGVNMFLIVAFIVVGIVILMAVGVFAYSRFLRSEADQKASELQAAEQNVDQDTVEGFLRLRDRLTSAQNILSNHIELSQFFSVLENLTVTSVRFSSLSVTVTPDHGADIKMSGVARDFNALAAQSASFATDKRIKQAIFSGINSDKGGVTFSVAAKLDPKLVVIPAASAVQAAPATTAAPVIFVPPAASSTPAAANPASTTPAAVKGPATSSTTTP